MPTSVSRSLFRPAPSCARISVCWPCRPHSRWGPSVRARSGGWNDRYRTSGATCSAARKPPGGHAGPRDSAEPPRDPQGGFSPLRSRRPASPSRVSRASAEQRRGRAGRLAPGICYRLWSRQEDAALPRPWRASLDRSASSRRLLAGTVSARPARRHRIGRRRHPPWGGDTTARPGPPALPYSHEGHGVGGPRAGVRAGGAPHGARSARPEPGVPEADIRTRLDLLRGKPAAPRHRSGGPREPDPEQVTRALMEGVRKEGLRVLPWNDGARRTRGRITFLRTHDAAWPDLSDQALTDELEEWLGPRTIRLTRLDHLARVDLSAALLDRPFTCSRRPDVRFR